MTFVSNQQAVDRWRAAMLPTYATPPLALVRGEGSRVWDAEGREYLDLVAGIAVNALGHRHPAVVAAVTEQLARLDHVSNLYVSEPSVRLAERLLALFGRAGKVFFCNSGAEANETALKLTRLTGRARLVAAENGFHGRTTGALALTGQPAKAAPFAPLIPGVAHVPFGDLTALRAAVGQAGDQLGGVVLEPIQGEAGVLPAPPGYLAGAAEAARAAGGLFVLDEVQTGIGRTGAWFAGAAQGVDADVVTLAKGLGGGLPIGACVAFGEAAGLVEPGQHGSTFGGNPLACAAGLAVLDVIERDGLLARVGALGERLAAGVLALGSPLVTEVRGAGLLRGIVLAAPVAVRLVADLRAAGVLVNATGPAVIRLAPPLTVTEAELDLFVERFGAALADLARAGAEPGGAA